MINAGLSIRDYLSHLVITLPGELDAANAAGLAAALAAVTAGNPRVIADLAALEFIDCCALGVLARVRAQARQAGGDLLLAAPGLHVRRLLTLTGLAGVFSICASADEATAAVGWMRYGGYRETPVPRPRCLIARDPAVA
jgi:anti-anti-sigma factor